jgi:hypothetical protein
MDIVTFLLARLDEQEADLAKKRGWPDRKKVAEITAKRSIATNFQEAAQVIFDRHSGPTGEKGATAYFAVGRLEAFFHAVRLLAAVHVNHPDFDREWLSPKFGPGLDWVYESLGVPV